MIPQQLLKNFFIQLYVRGFALNKHPRLMPAVAVSIVAAGYISVFCSSVSTTRTLPK
jgi:hypothetical protein